VSQPLRNATGSLGTVSNLSDYAAELEILHRNSISDVLSTAEAIVEKPTVFVLEKHLEDFLVHNWQHTSLGQRYQIYTEDGDIVGQQYPVDTGRIDILAISKDKKNSWL